MIATKFNDFTEQFSDHSIEITDLEQKIMKKFIRTRIEILGEAVSCIQNQICKISQRETPRLKFTIPKEAGTNIVAEQTIKLLN